MSTEQVRRGDWFQSIKGRKVWPLDPRPEDVDIEEIAQALSHICRFGGHVPGGPYSVAQHSVYVSRCVAETRPDLAILGLLHDAPEAYLGDIIRPIKRSGCVTEEYRLADAAWMRAIGTAIGITFPDKMPAEVKIADDRVLMTERRDLLIAGPAWRERAYGALDYKIPAVGWGPVQSQLVFMHEYALLRKAA